MDLKKTYVKKSVDDKEAAFISIRTKNYIDIYDFTKKDLIKFRRKFNKILTNLKYQEKNNTNLEFYLQIIFSTVKTIKDENLKKIFLLGLSNLFTADKYNLKAKYLRIITFLYLFQYEKEYWDIDWTQLFFKILAFDFSYSQLRMKFNQMWSVEHFYDPNMALKFYLILNSKCSEHIVNFYKLHLTYDFNSSAFNSLFDMVTELKSKLFEINN